MVNANFSTVYRRGKEQSWSNKVSVGFKSDWDKMTREERMEKRKGCVLGPGQVKITLCMEEAQ